MSIEWSYIIIAINCTITSIMIAYNMGNRKNESSTWWLEVRLKDLEKEVSCLRSLVKMNMHTFSDQINKTMKDFEKKINDK